MRIIEEQPGVSKCNARSTYNNLFYIWDDTDSSVNVMNTKMTSWLNTQRSRAVRHRGLDGLARRQHRKSFGPTFHYSNNKQRYA